ncbi:hypothetical protein [uncultured Thiodictyon sp.]|nr:hypothetical protein [uncultured Thiodictyon sp.]
MRPKKLTGGLRRAPSLPTGLLRMRRTHRVEDGRTWLAAQTF